MALAFFAETTGSSSAPFDSRLLLCQPSYSQNAGFVPCRFPPNLFLVSRTLSHCDVSASYSRSPIQSQTCSRRSRVKVLPAPSEARPFPILDRFDPPVSGLVLFLFGRFVFIGHLLGWLRCVHKWAFHELHTQVMELLFTGNLALHRL